MDNKNKIIFLVVILASIFFGVFAGCLGLSNEQIVSEVQKKYTDLKDYKGQMVMTISLEGNQETTEMNFIYKLPDKFEQKYLTGLLKGNIVVSNGSTTWVYDSQANDVTITAFSREDRKPVIDFGPYILEMHKIFDIQHFDSERIGDREVFILDMIPKNSTNKTILKQKLWIDKETWMPLRIENYDKIGKPVITIEYRNLEINTGVQDDDFNFQIPPGTKIITKELPQFKEMTIEEARKAVNFTIIIPDYPSGINRPDRVTLSKYDDVQSVSFNYKIGNETLLIRESNPPLEYSKTGLETIIINGKNATYLESGYRKILFWTEKNLSFAISGTISKEELVKGAESIK